MKNHVFLFLLPILTFTSRNQFFSFGRFDNFSFSFLILYFAYFFSLNSALFIVFGLGQSCINLSFLIFSHNTELERKLTWPKEITVIYRYCLACYGLYWIGFASDFGLYRRQTSQQGTILVPGLVTPKPSRTRTSHPIFFLSG